MGHNIEYSEMQSGLDFTQLFDLMVALIGSKQKTDETKRQKRGEAEAEAEGDREKRRQSASKENALKATRLRKFH